MADTDERLQQIEKKIDALGGQIAKNFAILEKVLKQHIEKVAQEHSGKK